MSHSDDNGLVLPPKLAPAQVVILPIYRDADERATVLPYCESLKQELAAQTYDGEPIRVRIDDRDIRGGEKKWQWVKRGVPLRVEVGPRDIAEGNISVSRRDAAAKLPPMPRGEFVASAEMMLTAIQGELFAAAKEAREAAGKRIDDLKEFEAFFTPKNEERPEIHGGLAYCHFVDSPEMDEKLKALKVTIRCVPIDAEEEPGQCIFTGRPSTLRGLFAKAY